jgi:hypothetical protein
LHTAAKENKSKLLRLRYAIFSNHYRRPFCAAASRHFLLYAIWKHFFTGECASPKLPFFVTANFFYVRKSLFLTCLFTPL